MKYSNFIKVSAAGICSAVILSACGAANDNSAELIDFRQKVDTFCTSIATADSNINAVNTEVEGYEQSILTELDNLDVSFREFAALDFPSDYDYLEALAKEASSYMDTAVENYHDVFENEYSATDLESKYTYASENYNRAYKRIQIIVSFLNGEISDGVTVTNNQQ